MTVKRVVESFPNSIPNNEEDAKSQILTNETGKLMANSVSQIYDRSRVAMYLYQALGIMLEKQGRMIDDLILQTHPQTATWGLAYWEDEYGIYTDKSKTLEERRTYLTNNVFIKKSAMTPARIKQLVKGITGFDCAIKEDMVPNTIIIMMRNYVEDTSRLIKELDKKLPAHLLYEIQTVELENVTIYSSAGVAVSSFERYEVEVLE